MTTASFVMLIFLVLLVLACLIILIIELVAGETGVTGLSSFSSSSSVVPVTFGPVGASTGQLTTASSTYGASLFSLGPNHSAFFGDGADRDQKFKNATGLSLSSDVFYNNLTLDNCTLLTNGYRIFVAGTLTLLNNSFIKHTGNDGANNTSAGAGPVPGGLGATGGTLGGGGNGGYGFLKDGSNSLIHGGSSSNVLWENNTTLYAGSDATTSPAVAPYGVGKAGKLETISVRSAFEAVQALNASYKPSTALLSGGSGGGGGQGSGQYPGSAGGGGGGVIVLAVRNLIVPTGGATINVAGGNGGQLLNGGPYNATSGGGGGGGLILLATTTPPESYNGLMYNVEGGLSLDTNGQPVQAAAGRVINWFHPTEVDTNPNQFYVATNSQSQSFNPGNPVKSISFPEVEFNIGITADENSAVFTVSKGGMYLINSHFHLEGAVAGAVAASVVRNGDPNNTVYGRKVIAQEDANLAQNIMTAIPLQPKDTFEIRVARINDPGIPVTIAPGSSLFTTLVVST